MNPHTTARRALMAALALLMTAAPPAPAQLPATEHEGAQAIGLALRRLGHSKRVLMIGAHPDDESTQILSTLALGQGARVAYLSLTRGEGGQNGIGPELQEGLGLLRSEELLSARRLDGARQFFTRAYDYGFSKSADEAFRHWPRDSVLADVVAVIRSFRPDLVVSIFSGTTRDGHGQHQAAGILAREAFTAAADPARFPGQIARGLGPHAPEKLYQALWRADDGADQRLQTGSVDPLLGRSHYEVAMASRSRHRSQDMGRILTPGPQSSAFTLVDGGHAGAGLFAGVDTTLSRRASGIAPLASDLERYEERVAAALAAFDLFDPSASVVPLAESLHLLDRVAARAGALPDELGFRIDEERAELVDAIWRAAGLRLDAVATDEAVVPGQAVELELTLWNGGARPVRVEDLAPALPDGWDAEPIDPLPAEVRPGEIATRRFTLRVPPDASPTQPYFLRSARDGDLYAWPDTVDVGVPFEPPTLVARAAVTLAGRSLDARTPATFRGVDKMQGEIRRPLRVVPAVSVLVEPDLAILPVGAAPGEPIRLTVRLTAESPDGIEGVLSVRPPAGWTADRAETPVTFAEPGEERVIEVSIYPPAQVMPGTHQVDVSFVTGTGAVHDRGYRLVDYPHTSPRALYRSAAVTVRALDVRVPEGLRVGYVAGPGDEVQAALRQLGVAVDPLDSEALASGDLSRYDVIVTGIRAYEVRPDLAAHNRRLLDYAAAGGTLIVQYNKYEYETHGIAPFAVSMSRPHDRVTDETAPVRLLRPEHAALTTPNRISARDFEGWVHERGLYFLAEWGEPFTPLLAMSDPDEPPLHGGLLVGPYGEGTYVYTGLAFFRQLPAGVPGAYRLFANLLALGNSR